MDSMLNWISQIPNISAFLVHLFLWKSYPKGTSKTQHYNVRQRNYTNKNAEYVSTSFSHGLSSGELMFVFSGKIKLQIWRQVFDIVTLCFWCPFCIWLSLKLMHKKCRNVRDLGNSVQHWIHVIVKFLVL